MPKHITQTDLETPGSAANTVLSSTYVRPSLNTIVWLGDSITEQGGLRPTNGNTDGRSFWPWAQTLLGNRLRTVANSGIGGNTSAQMLARIQTDVLAHAPGYCHVLAGTNDTRQSVPLETTKANLTAIYDTLNTAGVRVIAGTVPPDGDAVVTQAQRNNTMALNEWLRGLARSRRNFILADYAAALTDPVTGGVITGYMQADQTHLEQRGGFAAGRVLADALASVVPPSPVLFSNPTDPKNLIRAASRFPGNATAAPTGWLPQSFTVAPTYSKVARTDGVAGNWQSVVVPAGDKVSLASSVNIGTELAIGDTIEAGFEYDISNLEPNAAAGTQAFYAILQCYDGAAFPTAGKLFAFLWDPSKPNMPATARKGTMLTPKVTVPAGTTLAQLAIYLRGGGTYLLDRAFIRKA